MPFETIRSFRSCGSTLGVVGVAGYPLEVRGEILGAIGYLARRMITPEEFEVLGIFADQAAMAIKSAHLFRELERHKERLEVENEYLQDELRLDSGFDNIIGESAALARRAAEGAAGRVGRDDRPAHRARPAPARS